MEKFEIKNCGVCNVSVAPVRSRALDEAEIVTQLLFGDYVQVLKVEEPWIRIRLERDGYEGWMDFKQLTYIDDIEYNNSFKLNHQLIQNKTLDVSGPRGIQTLVIGGALPNYENGKFNFGSEEYSLIEEMEEMRPSPVDTALVYLNSPYLWGGKSLFGIDCSGLLQNIAMLNGHIVPRDSSKQINYGEEINFPDRKAGDIPFFINDKGVIHHLGILTEKDVILHASGCVRKDRLDETGIFREDFDDYTHKLHSIRRWF